MAPVDPLPTPAVLSAQVRKVMANGIGRPVRAGAPIPDLEAVALEIVRDPDLAPMARVAEAIERAIGTHGRRPYGEAMRAVFGVSDEARTLPALQDRVALASKQLGKSVEKPALLEMSSAVAWALLDLVKAGRTNPDPEQVVAGASLSNARRIALAVFVVGALAVLALFVARSPGSKSASYPSLRALEHAAERHLTTKEVVELERGGLRSTLGFGNAMVGGGPKFHYTKSGFRAQTSPIFDAIENLNYGIGDERRFLNITASLTADSRQLSHFAGHAAMARPHDIVWVDVRIDNNAAPTPHCSLTGRAVARDTHLKFQVWNAPDGRLHVIRGWLGAVNTRPRWITDAVAVVTSSPATLEPDNSLSREYSYLSQRYVETPLIAVEPAVLSPDGLLVGEHGLVGSCWNDVYFLTLGFRQQLD